MRNTSAGIAPTSLMNLFGVVLVVLSGTPTWDNVALLKEPGIREEGSAEEFFDKGLYQFTLGSFYASASYFEKCLKKNSQDSLEKEATYWLGLSLTGTGQHAEGQRRLDGLLRKSLPEPLYGATVLSLGDSHRTAGNCRKAKEYYERVIKSGSAFVPVAMRGEALCLEQEGRRAESISIYEEIVSRFPDSQAAAEGREKLFREKRKLRAVSDKN